MTLITIIEERFPTRVAYGYAGGVSWQTQRVTTGGGFVFKNKRWKTPLRRFTVDTENASLEDFAELNAFLHAVGQGAFGTFRLKDWADFEAIEEVMNPAAGDGSNRIFQAQKTYTYNSKSFVRPIYKPNTDVTAEFLVAGVTQAPANYDFDVTTGLLTFHTGHAPAMSAAVTWTGQFDIAAEFDDDYQPATYENFTQVNAKGIALTEVRLA